MTQLNINTVRIILSDYSFGSCLKKNAVQARRNIAFWIFVSLRAMEGFVKEFSSFAPRVRAISIEIYLIHNDIRYHQGAEPRSYQV
jgi:alpha/beta superfamily hydrolase